MHDSVTHFAKVRCKLLYEPLPLAWLVAWFAPQFVAQQSNPQAQQEAAVQEQADGSQVLSEEAYLCWPQSQCG